MTSKSRNGDIASDTARLRHESPTIDVFRTLFWATVVIALVVLSCIAGRAVYSALLLPPSDRSLTPLHGEGLSLPSEPRLEGIEMMSAASATTSAFADDRLQKYGWIDREKKIVHIPIARAMDLAIERDWLRSAAPKPNQARKQPDMPKTPADNTPEK